MSKYRKKPIVVEAYKLTVENMDKLEEWCHGSIRGTKLPARERVIKLWTYEGEMIAELGDYIVKEPFPTETRKFYPCKPDIFKQTYEPLEEE